MRSSRRKSRFRFWLETLPALQSRLGRSSNLMDGWPPAILPARPCLSWEHAVELIGNRKRPSYLYSLPWLAVPFINLSDPHLSFGIFFLEDFQLFETCSHSFEQALIHCPRRSFSLSSTTLAVPPSRYPINQQPTTDRRHHVQIRKELHQAWKGGGSSQGQ